jgi:hemerythrin
MKMKYESLDETQNDESTEYVVWDEQYATGVLVLDNQHKELMNLTNHLFHACRAGTQEATAVFAEAMHKMVEYVRFHFSAEQVLLERINYPEYQEHKNEHDRLVREILIAVKEFNEGQKFVPYHFVKILKEWIFGHIAVADKGYALFVANQKRLGLLTDKHFE